ncbi:MAG: hypothetical protein H6822_34140 [Planctomycetaceae bacterium]|nr:hypothetical protein [Planctomycetales bacterium]MCB9927226.1 hypothetical protein [Planctomycetaceae bacterium]
MARAALLLTGFFIITFPAFAIYGNQAHGRAGIVASVVAAFTCWVAGVVALAFVSAFRRSHNAFNGVGLAMVCRMMIPMAVGFVATKLSGPLAEAGVFGMIVGFYLVGLLVETLLAVRLVNSFTEERVSKAA